MWLKCTYIAISTLLFVPFFSALFSRTQWSISWQLRLAYWMRISGACTIRLKGYSGLDGGGGIFLFFLGVLEVCKSDFD